jgi:hypothetical protein
MTLRDIKKRFVDWDETDKNAIFNTSHLINILGEPFSISPSDDNGISLHYGKEDRDVFIECYSDGEVRCTFFQNGENVESKDLIFDDMTETQFAEDILYFL